jgi:hypothetical protein
MILLRACCACSMRCQRMGPCAQVFCGRRLVYGPLKAAGVVPGSTLVLLETAPLPSTAPQHSVPVRAHAALHAPAHTPHGPMGCARGRARRVGRLQVSRESPATTCARLPFAMLDVHGTYPCRGPLPPTLHATPPNRRPPPPRSAPRSSARLAAAASSTSCWTRCRARRTRRSACRPTSTWTTSSWG